MAFLLSGVLAYAQPPDSLHSGRAWAVGGGGVLLGAGSLVLLDQAWYADHPRASFHFFDDSGEWLQMDKLGHAWSAYTLSNLGHAGFRWAGVKERTATWLGAGYAMAYLTGIEYLDGRSAQWGFSWSDAAANAFGTALFTGQQLGWGRQRFVLKYSAHLTDFAQQRPALLGSSTPERLLKDYNGATLWISAGLQDLGWKKMPAWLNVSVGHGAHGMVSAHPGPDAYRRRFLAPDINLRALPVKGKFLRTAFFLLDHIKVPLPALEITGRGVVRGHWLYF